MSIALSVNLNKIALIRNSREGNYPDVREFGEVALQAGAQGLTVHPRPDQRHIRPRDVRELADLVANRRPQCEFNIEGNPFAPPQDGYPGLLSLVEEVQPDQCTLVPDSNDQLTSDHGFDLERDGQRLQPIIDQLHALGIRVSLFMDPDTVQISRAAALGADRVELYTGPYAAAFSNNPEAVEEHLAPFEKAAIKAHELGLGVNAGHDLNLRNLAPFSRIPHLAEVSIGHALTVDALKMGMAKTVNAYLKLCAAKSR